MNERSETPDCHEGFGFDLKPEACRKPNGSKQAQMILAEPLLRIADRTDQLPVQIGAAVHKIKDLSAQRIEEQRIYGEIAPPHVLLRVGLEMHPGWSAAVGILEVDSKSGHFHLRRAVAHE